MGVRRGEAVEAASSPMPGSFQAELDRPRGHRPPCGSGVHPDGAGEGPPGAARRLARGARVAGQLKALRVAGARVRPLAKAWVSADPPAVGATRRAWDSCALCAKARSTMRPAPGGTGTQMVSVTPRCSVGERSCRPNAFGAGPWSREETQRLWSWAVSACRMERTVSGGILGLPEMRREVHTESKRSSLFS